MEFPDESWRNSPQGLPVYSQFLADIYFSLMFFNILQDHLFPYLLAYRLPVALLSTAQFGTLHFFRANASFVRCEIRLRSISALRLNANAKILLLMLFPSS